ncbi:pyridoxal 5'-phosphate dependent enzyme [Wigglesworthia glossinidia endosymbiont of Glossina morsitans morsitans (Yale colony)]|uniref:Pyridoxal phosphate homeostasis protein n=2 Tax=Wigglesworthia glossinidia TaxID=51229 RepID=H6Q5P0_WIGGL|nr:pyridoxal 5'-phosphate dependent enzyme [Wigglesworthia glossinidia endosymbiont of Glossina morsitans morsitans (Yale colony)]
MHVIQENFKKIKELIKKSAKLYNKNPKNINLLVVSKSRSTEEIQLIQACKQNHFGESYAQEAINKILWFKKNQPKNKLVWHMIGLVQSNKSILVSKYFDWCHTIGHINVAKNLNKHREKVQKSLQVLIQINLNQEMSKYGANLKDVQTIAEFIHKKCIYLKLRGIMAIPIKTNNFVKQRANFYNLYQVFFNLQNIYPNIDILSTGMTNDMIAAIAEGSTLLRIGNGIFQNKK